MTIDSKRFTRPLIMAAAFAAIFTISPSRVDHGALFGVSAAMAHGRSGGDHGGFGGAGRHGDQYAITTSAKARRATAGPIPILRRAQSPAALARARRATAGSNSDPAASAGSPDISQGAPRNSGATNR